MVIENLKERKLAQKHGQYIELLDILISQIEKEISQIDSKSKKSSKDILFHGKELNIPELFMILNDVLDLKKSIKSSTSKPKDRNQLLAYILRCNKSNAGEILNGTYNGQVKKDREELIKDYLKKLK